MGKLKLIDVVPGAFTSKTDGTQNLDLQNDALVEAGIDSENIYSDQCSGKKADRPGLDACIKALRRKRSKNPPVQA